MDVIKDWYTRDVDPSSKTTELCKLAGKIQ